MTSAQRQARILAVVGEFGEGVSAGRLHAEVGGRPEAVRAECAKLVEAGELVAARSGLRLLYSMARTP